MKHPGEKPQQAPRAEAPRPWVTPSVQDMPRLEELTLQTGLVMTGRRSRRGFRV